jgi:hypothetical protein
MVRGKEGELIVVEDLESRGFIVKKVNAGYDLEAQKGDRKITLEVKITEKTPEDRGFHIPHCYSTEFALDSDKNYALYLIADYLAFVHSFRTGNPQIAYIPKSKIDELCKRHDDSVWVKRMVVIKAKFTRSLIESSKAPD